MTRPGLADGPIYLDYNATTPVDPRVVDAALPYLTHHFGQPLRQPHLRRKATRRDRRSTWPGRRPARRLRGWITFTGQL
jgi:hypothetical protein